MGNIEQAYRALGLRPGASLKEVIEAHEDLLMLWNPERLADRPRLRVKAPAQINEINSAYEILLEHLGQKHAQKPRGPSAPAQRPSASLFDEVFSERLSKKTRRIPPWGSVALVVVVGVLIIYLSQPSTTTEPVSPVVSGETLKDPPPPGNQSVVTGETSEQQLQKPAASENQAEPLTDAPSKKEPAPPSLSVPAPARQKPGPVLFRDEIVPPEKVQVSGSQQETAGERGNSPSEAATDAYHRLLEKSPAASGLVNGRFGSFRFQEWKVVQEGKSEIWIDLVATGSESGSPVHFIWSVNTETGNAKPLSQAARNLEADARP